MALPDINGAPLLQGGQVAANNGGQIGAASLFENIAQESRRFRQSLQPVLDAEYREQASEDVLQAAADREDGNTAPDVPTKRAFTRQGAIYNHVVQTNMLATAKADYADKARELAAQHQYDPEGFAAAAESFIEGYSKDLDAPADLMMALEREGRGMFGQTGARIEERTRVAAAKETQDSMQRRLGQIQAEIATLIETDGAPGLFGEEYQALEKEAIDLIGILADNPAYGWSDEQAADALDSIANQGQELVSIQQMKGIYYKDGAAAALKYIPQAVNSMTLNQQERIGADSRMRAELSKLQQLQNIEEKEREAADKEKSDAMTRATAAFEAELLNRMSTGEKPNETDINRMQSLVSGGWMTPARMGTYVNAMLADDPTNSDETYKASLFDYARTPGVTAEDVQETTLLAVSEGYLTTEDRESILRSHEKFSDDRVQAGVKIMDGMFATGFMDIDSGAVRNAKTAAEADLFEWYDSNPEASRQQIQQKARQLSVEHGRRVPPPPIPQVPGVQTNSFVDPQNIDAWEMEMRIRALKALQAGEYDDDEFSRAGIMIDERVAWQRSQTQLQQENVNAPRESE